MRDKVSNLRAIPSGGHNQGANLGIMGWGNVPGGLMESTAWCAAGWCRPPPLPEPMPPKAEWWCMRPASMAMLAATAELLRPLCSWWCWWWRCGCGCGRRELVGDKEMGGRLDWLLSRDRIAAMEKSLFAGCMMMPDADADDDEEDQDDTDDWTSLSEGWFVCIWSFFFIDYRYHCVKGISALHTIIVYFSFFFLGKEEVKERKKWEQVNGFTKREEMKKKENGWSLTKMRRALTQSHCSLLSAPHFRQFQRYAFRVTCDTTQHSVHLLIIDEHLMVALNGYQPGHRLEMRFNFLFNQRN